jgi:hypothetical protein
MDAAGSAAFVVRGLPAITNPSVPLEARTAVARDMRVAWMDAGIHAVSVQEALSVTRRIISA